MISLVVISVGFLGLATMVMRTQQAKKRSQDFQDAQTIAKKKMTLLSSLDYEDLATGTTSTEKIQYGAADEEVVSYGPVNRLGLTQSESSQGPHRFTVSFVVCLDNTEGGQTAASQGGDACGNVKTSRPNELSCDVTRTDPGEAEIRLLTTYRDTHGQCHKVAMSNIQVDLEL